MHDVDAVVALVESAFRGDSSRMGWTTEADMIGGQRTDAEKVSELIAEPGTRIVLAEQGGTLVGSMVLKVEESSVYLGMFAVQPRLQGTGIGKQLLVEAERLARNELRKTTLRITVIAQRPELVAWYERHGYQRTGRREPFPYGDVRYGLPNRDDLYFVELRKGVGRAG